VVTEEFSLPVRVYIEDTDAGGIVYYVNYLKYLERARTEFMRALGFDKPAFSGDELMFVVTELSAHYHRPARLDDALQATALLKDVGAATLHFEQRVYRDDSTLMVADVRLALVAIASGRPRRLPKVLRAALTAQQTK